MKPKEYVYNFISKPDFVQTGDEGYAAQFLYCDEIYMAVHLRKVKDRYEVHYPFMDLNFSKESPNFHTGFKRERNSYKQITPYFYCFKSKNHANAVEKEIKLAFRRWLRFITKSIQGNNDE